MIINKFFIVIFAFVVLYSQNTYAQNNIKVNSKSTKTITSKKHQFVFRKINWGMNHLQVLASEKQEPLIKNSDRITFQEKLFNKNVKVNYYFENDKVVKSEYVFDDSFNNKSEYIIYYKKLKDYLKKINGKFTSDTSKELDILGETQYDYLVDLISRGELEYKTVWIKPDTSIKLGINGNDFVNNLKLFMIYKSNSYKQKNEEKQSSKSLF